MIVNLSTAFTQLKYEIIYCVWYYPKEKGRKTAKIIPKIDEALVSKELYCLLSKMQVIPIHNDCGLALVPTTNHSIDDVLRYPRLFKIDNISCCEMEY